jgi:hypothetical protein
VIVAWHVEQGQYGAVDRAGVHALFAYAPGHMTEGSWQVALHTDDRASHEQAQAFGEIFSGQAGGHLAAFGPLIGEVLGVKAVPIEYHAEGNKRSVWIDTVTEAK